MISYTFSPLDRQLCTRVLISKLIKSTRIKSSGRDFHHFCSSQLIYICRPTLRLILSELYWSFVVTIVSFYPRELRKNLFPILEREDKGLRNVFSNSTLSYLLSLITSLFYFFTQICHQRDIIENPFH